jgi:hypothetical protein
MVLILNGKKVMVFLDMATDVSVIAELNWPSTWPYVQATADLKHVSSATAPLQSACAICWHDEEGHFYTICAKNFACKFMRKRSITGNGSILYSPSPNVSLLHARV